MYIEDFNGILVPYSELISFTEGSVSENFPLIVGKEVFYKIESEFHKGVVVNQFYANGSLLEIKLEDNENTTQIVPCQYYNDVYLIL